MTDLILGVVDVPYDNGGAKPTTTRKGRPKSARSLQREQDGHDTYSNGPTTTVQVATILEEHYGVMQVFFDQLEDHIASAAIHSLEGALENLYAGSPIGDPFAEMGQEVQAAFRVFLMSGQIEQLGIEGVPTEAAIKRRSLRFKNKIGPAQRPSFVDSGVFEASFRAWTTS